MTPQEYAERTRAMEAKLRDIGELLGVAIEQADGWGFCLMMFDFGKDGVMSYISNAQRENMIHILHEFLGRLSAGDRGTLGGREQASWNAEVKS